MREHNKVSWPGWETVRLIGRGSFGAVYEIQRDVFGEVEKAALKVISIPQNASDIDEMYSDGYNDESITSTFQDHLKGIVAEYSLMRKMNGCPNIVSCDDIRYIQHDDGFGWDIFIKMELLTPLTRVLLAQVSEDAVVTLAKDLCNALVVCKEHNIVHRDIKPQNIFVSQYGDYKLGDFGIAKTVEKTMGGTKIGTYKYMAPEVYNNQPYNSAADIYSLGLVLYWLLNERRLPFLPLPPENVKAGMEEQARLRRFSGEQLPHPAHGSEKLKKIVQKACAYDPKDRYANAAEMLEDLEAMGTARMSGKAFPTVVPYVEVREQADEATVGLFGSNVAQHRSEQGEETETAVGLFEINNGHQADKRPKNESASDIAKTAVPHAGQPKPNNEEKKNLLVPIIGIAIVVVILLLLRSCRGAGTVEPIASSETTLPTETAVKQPAQWSAWVDILPDSVTEENYLIEEQILYRCREQFTTSSTTEKEKEGWTLQNTVKSGEGYGIWSDWSTTKTSGSDTREVETRTVYRYRDKKHTTSTSSAKSGWTLYDTTYTWGNYGAWSNWSVNKVAASDSRAVEQKTQYQYRDKEYTTSSNSTLDGWNYYDTTYSEWGNPQTSSTKPTESDALRITAVTQTGWGYYHYCNYYANGGNNWNVDSIPYGSPNVWHAYTSSFALPAVSFADKGGSQTYGGSGSGAHACGYGFYIWFRNTGADTYTYTYETRTATHHFYRYPDKWSSWSDTPVTASSSREVNTRVLYRYKDRAQIPTYHFWAWGDWTSWSTTKVTANNNREVEHQTQYRYRDEVTATTYIFSKWSEWSDFGITPIEEKENLQVEIKIQYRYKKKE